jgi:hypothetical protein
MNTDDVLTEAVKLAEKTQNFRTMGDTISVIVGKSSNMQVIATVRKLAGQLVFDLQSDTPKVSNDVLLENLKALQGALLGVQLYGIINEAELEKCMKMTDTIYNGIMKR